MVKRGKRKLSKRRQGSRPINDINHNNTNITVNFRKVLPIDLVTSPNNMTFRALRLAPSIAQLTSDLGQIYKFYRFTNVRFTFQAELNQNLISDVAINYIPAQETVAGSPTSLEEFEGPAVGYFSNGRGTPYHYHVPSKVLNAMNYNWYETKGAEASDLTQGLFYILTNIPTASTIFIYANFTCEFQTLEDPAFLTNLTKAGQVICHNTRRGGEVSGLINQAKRKQFSRKRIKEEDEQEEQNIYYTRQCVDAL